MEKMSASLTQETSSLSLVAVRALMQFLGMKYGCRIWIAFGKGEKSS